MANLPKLSSAKTRSISPENFTGEKGKAGMATEGTGKNCRPRVGSGLEDFAVGGHSREVHVHDRRDQGPWRDSANLDDARPAR